MTVKLSMKRKRTYETTEATEKPSVSSRSYPSCRRSLIRHPVPLIPLRAGLDSAPDLVRGCRNDDKKGVAHVCLRHNPSAKSTWHFPFSPSSRRWQWSVDLIYVKHKGDRYGYRHSVIQIPSGYSAKGARARAAEAGDQTSSHQFWRSHRAGTASSHAGDEGILEGVGLRISTRWVKEPVLLYVPEKDEVLIYWCRSWRTLFLNLVWRPDNQSSINHKLFGAAYGAWTSKSHFSYERWDFFVSETLPY